MVDVSSPSSGSHTLNSPRSRSETSGKKPFWLLSIYVIFAVVCLNAISVYRSQKKLVRERIEERNQNDTMEIQYSAGAEEHVVSSNYGSSMYGGSIRAADDSSKKKKKKTKPARETTFQNIKPKPTDGSGDYIVSNSGSNSSDFNGFSFYVMTDTPYTDWQEKRLRSQMAELRDYMKTNPGRNISLGIHLGGTQKVSNSLCAESAYKDHAYLLSKGPRPTFVTPGNSDWLDCPRREEAFGFFLEHMGPSFVSNWHGEHYENFGIRRSDENPELFSFYIEGILFVGVHMIDGPPNQESSTGRKKRMKRSMEWFANTIESNIAEREIRGTVVMGHAGRSERNHHFFNHMAKYFVNITSRADIPVLYLHGDGLEWKIDRSYSEEAGWSPFYDVQIDQGGLAEPCIIDVAPQRKGVTKKLQKTDDDNGLETIIANGMFRLDQQKGRYLDPMDVV